MNIGFLSGYVMSGFIDIHDRYDRLFEVSNLINLITVFFIIKSWKYFAKNKINTREEIKRGRLGLILIIFIIFAYVSIIHKLSQSPEDKGAVQIMFYFIH